MGGTNLVPHGTKGMFGLGTKTLVPVTFDVWTLIRSIKRSLMNL